MTRARGSTTRYSRWPMPITSRPVARQFVTNASAACWAAHFERHLERHLVGAAVQRTEQRADRRRQCRGRRGQRRGHDARGKRAGVEAVIELQGLRRLEGRHLLGRGRDIVQELQEALAVTTRAGIRALRMIFERGMDQADRSRQARCDDQAFLFERVASEADSRRLQCQERCDGLQRRHRMLAMPRQLAQRCRELRRQSAGVPQIFLDLLQALGDRATRRTRPGAGLRRKCAGSALRSADRGSRGGRHRRRRTTLRSCRLRPLRAPSEPESNRL